MVSLRRGIRLGAGELLKLIDIAAGASAVMHAGSPRTPTLAFDHLDLMVPICHGELVDILPRSIPDEEADASGTHLTS
eukprot:1342498-Rhodomonas_salina.2